MVGKIVKYKPTWTQAGVIIVVSIAAYAVLLHISSLLKEIIGLLK